MKILNVRIKNINSLAGEHEIHFDRPPLDEVGIFAITGPNGSGKTTILDSICLALYGQTPRFKAQSEQVMNKRSSDCYAEVTFLVDRKRYRSKWSAERSGSAFHTRMQLAAVNGEETVVKETAASVREEINRLTGLDFKRFSRSVMLPQGEFSAFLHALSNERVEIIDKIVGRTAYQEYCAGIAAAAEMESERLATQKEFVAQLPRPGIDPALQENLDETEKSYLAAETDLEDLKKEKEWIRQREIDRQLYEETQIALSSALARKEAMRDDIRRLERARAAADFEADLHEHETQAKAVAEHEARIAELNHTIEKYHKELAGLRKKTALDRRYIEESQELQTANAERFDIAVAADREIDNAAQDFRDHVDRYEKIEREQKENLQAQARIKDEITRNESEAAATEKWLQKHLSVQKMEEADPRIRDLVLRLKSLREETGAQDVRRQESLQQLESARIFLEKARAVHVKALEKMEAATSRKAGQEETANAILADVSFEDLETGVQQNVRRKKHFRLLLKTAKGYQKQVSGNGGSVEEALLLKEKELIDLDAAYEARQTVMLDLQKKIKFDEERSQLSPGAPCPLCGSLDHPYTAGTGDAKSAKKQAKGMKKSLKKLLKSRKKLLSHIKNLQKRMEHIEQYQTTWERLCETWGVPWALGDVEPVRRALRDAKNEVRSGKKALKIVKRHEGKSKKMSQAVESAAEKLQERQAVLSEKESEVTLHRKLLAVIEQESAEMAAREREIAAALLEAVEPIGEKVPQPGAEEPFLAAVTARLVEYRARQNRVDVLAREGERLLDEARRLPESLKALKAEAEALEVQIEERQRRLNQLKKDREDRFGEDDPVRKQQSLADKIGVLTAELERLQMETEMATSTISEAKKELEEVQDAYQNAGTTHDTVDRLLKNKVIAGSVFRNMDDVRQSFMSAEEREIIQAHVTRVEGEIRRHRNTIEKLKLSAGEDLSERSAAEVDLAIDDAAKRLDLLKDELDRLTEQTEEAEGAEAFYQEERKVLEDIRQRFDELSALVLAIESGDDARVKKGFHEKMFGKLLEKAGGYVGMLNGHRYDIRPAEKDPFGLEVEVKTNGQTSRRPVESLSGGETFLISLSMALALSDLTDGSRRIQSLFIDEGFGSLDDENLTQVINTLNEHLKANGKRVGVISHVSRLDEEFHTKIQVIPEKGGKTRLEIFPKENWPDEIQSKDTPPERDTA